MKEQQTAGHGALMTEQVHDLARRCRFYLQSVGAEEKP